MQNKLKYSFNGWNNFMEFVSYRIIDLRWSEIVVNLSTDAEYIKPLFMIEEIELIE